QENRADRLHSPPDHSRQRRRQLCGGRIAHQAARLHWNGSAGCSARTEGTLGVVTGLAPATSRVPAPLPFRPAGDGGGAGRITRWRGTTPATTDAKVVQHDWSRLWVCDAAD